VTEDCHKNRLQHSQNEDRQKHWNANRWGEEILDARRNCGETRCTWRVLEQVVRPNRISFLFVILLANTSKF
jgi:hypothetical protein